MFNFLVLNLFVILLFLYILESMHWVIIILVTLSIALTDYRPHLLLIFVFVEVFKNTELINLWE